jgi:sigma-B regulation protein RsbU (phosphoserine phosphatase)
VRILVAEDDPVSRTLLTRSLEQWGHEVEPVADGMEAYGRLLRPNAPPIAILDWTMPGLEGPEICRQVRAATLRMQPYLVILTARHTAGDLATALESGADDFLSKPFDRVELQARLQAGVRIINLHRALTDRIQELEESRQREHSLRTLTPICSYCKKIRGDRDTWEPIDQYLAEHGYRITHAVCPTCLDGMSTLPPMPRSG